MAHQLRIITDSATLPVYFNDDLDSQVDVLLRQAADLPSHWSSTRYDTDVAALTWATGGSRAQVIAMLLGCREHGWPFVPYVRARSNDEPATWSVHFEATYLGWWSDRNAFAQEIAVAGAYFAEEDFVADLDRGQVHEICSGFVCLDVDGQVIVFDGLPDHEWT